MRVRCVTTAIVLALAPAALRPRAVAGDEASPDADAARKAALAKALALNQRCGELYRRGRYAEATELAREIVTLRERALGPDHPGVAMDLNTLGALLRAQGRPADARPCFERALAIRLAALGADHSDVATSLNNLGLVRHEQGAYAEARQLYERALATAERSVGRDHPKLATTLLCLARLSQDEARFGEARALFERSLQIREAAFGRDHPSVADSLNGLGSLLTAVGAYEEARAAYFRALEIRERSLGKDHPDVAVTLGNLALLLREQGAHDAAQAHARRALAIQEKALGVDHPGLATTLGNLALFLEDAGAYAEARPYFERALALRAQAFGPDHPEVATALVNFGDLLRKEGDLDAAWPLLERGLAIRERVLGPRHPDVATSLGAMATLLCARGKDDAAHALLERALAIRESAVGADHPTVATMLVRLATTLRALARYAEARALVERALALREAAPVRDPPGIARVLSHLGVFLELEGDVDAARRHFLRALELTEVDVRTRFAGIGSAQRLALRRSTRYHLDNWVRSSVRTDRPGYEEVLGARGVVTRVEAAERAFTRRASDDDLTRHAALRVVERRVARLAHAMPPSRDPEVRAAWQRAYAEAAAERERATLELTTRAVRVNPWLGRHDLRLTDVQAGLPPDTALVDFLRVGKRYVAWIVRAAAAPALVVVGEPDPIDEACRSFVAAVAEDAVDADAARVLDAAGATCRSLVWAPIEAKFGGDVTRVVICPDAALAAIPFAALPGKTHGTALADELAISYVFHPFDVVPTKDALPTGTGAVAVGGVDFDHADVGPASYAVPPRPDVLAAVDRAPRGGTFIPIPGTRLEAETLLDRLGRDATTLLLGADATEARLRVAVKGKRFAHVATHGFAREDLGAGLSTRWIEEAWTSADAERQLAVGHDPMLLSGLALAGANPRDGGGDEDGILTALEASYLDLDGVDLVTLSACETARGTAESGEGVLGLVSAFQMAGARRVLASLWKVDDDATRRLMDGVYERILRKENPLAPADALREAALALRSWKDPTGKARFAAPRYWAAFVAYGG